MLPGSVMKRSLLGTSREVLSALLQERGEPAYRGEQVFRWVHQQRIRQFREMTNLPESLRQELDAGFTLDYPQVVDQAHAGDGACKWRLGLQDGLAIEAVYIPAGTRQTLCISSQVGCAFGCTFCATATMGRLRHLTAGEIVGQVFALCAGHELQDAARAFNLVFMGMGEPLDNYDQVLAAFDILTDDAGAGISWRRITLSTVGHVDGIQRLARRTCRPRLAVSLNATTDNLRNRIMPINRKWPLAVLHQALTGYPVRAGEKITFEYVLMAGETDSAEDAGRLAAFLHGLPARLNLIPWNACSGLPHARPEDGQVEIFRDRLLDRGLDASIRFSRGGGAAAACGQLVTAPRSSARSQHV